MAVSPTRPLGPPRRCPGWWRGVPGLRAGGGPGAEARVTLDARGGGAYSCAGLLALRAAPAPAADDQEWTARPTRLSATWHPSPPIRRRRTHARAPLRAARLFTAADAGLRRAGDTAGPAAL